MSPSLRPLLALLLGLATTTALADDGSSPTGFAKRTESNQQVADRYVAAYFDKRWDDLSAASGDALSFEDPTALLVFGPPPERDSKAKVLELFRTGYAPLELKFDQLRAMYSGDHAFYEGNLDWVYHLPERDIHSITPMIVILRLENGKVVEHRDYVDYRPFIEAEIASRPKKDAPTSP